MTEVSSEVKIFKEPKITVWGRKGAFSIKIYFVNAFPLYSDYATKIFMPNKASEILEETAERIEKAAGKIEKKYSDISIWVHTCATYYEITIYIYDSSKILDPKSLYVEHKYNRLYDNEKGAKIFIEILSEANVKVDDVIEGWSCKELINLLKKRNLLKK